MNDAQRIKNLSESEEIAGDEELLAGVGGFISAIAKGMLFSRKKGENQWLTVFTNTKLVFDNGAAFGVAS